MNAHRTPADDDPGPAPATGANGANGSGETDDADDEAPRNPHRRYARSLTAEERQLLRLRVELYGNSWDRMLADLQDRLKGRPYIFKLVHRIEQDIDRLQKLQSYEQKHRIDLVDFVDT